MRALLAIVVLAALGWSGFWYWNASMRDRALTGWLEERRAAGWVSNAEVRVTGFPNRVDAVVTDIDLANPQEGWSWTAPEFQILSQTWKPHHVIAVWPDHQVIATPYDTIDVASGRMVASAVFEPTLRLGLDHSTVEMRDLALTGAAGWQAGLGEALLSVRLNPGADVAPFTYDLDFNAKALTLPEDWIAGIERSGLLPRAIDGGHLAANLTFDRPWDRPAIEGETPALRSMTISELRFNWGELDLSGAGTLGVDARGYAEGRLDLAANNWRGMLEVAERSGALNGTLAGTLRAGLGLYASLSGNRGDSLKIPLEFADGEMRLGPVPIGRAPMLGRGA
jgi:hypothetical protein